MGFKGLKLTSSRFIVLIELFVKAVRFPVSETVTLVFVVTDYILLAAVTEVST